MDSAVPRGKRPATELPDKAWKSLAIALAMLLLVELGLQVRSHLRYGQSVFNAISGDTTYVVDAATGLKILRPNAVISGAAAVIRTNSLGLRDDELPTTKPPAELWVGVLGASTVMGTYTRDNVDTMPAQLSAALSTAFRPRTFRVLNAGIAGYGLREQRLMLERLKSTVDLDGVVIYPGFNDLTRYCTGGRGVERRQASHSLAELRLPSWLLSVELLTKNTVALREVKAGKRDLVDPASVDLEPYRQQVRGLLEASLAFDRVLLVGNARAFRSDMPPARQQSLSQSARYYMPCFSAEGLGELFDRHNAVLAEEAARIGIPFLDMMRHLEGGERNFGDATHFSKVGTERAAQAIAVGIANWF